MLLAKAAAEFSKVQPVYISVGLAWEPAEQEMARRFVTTLPNVMPLVILSLDMTDVYSRTHWAVRGEAPAYDTPDEDVYLEGRNIILLSKAAVFMARTQSLRLWIGLLANNPFPDSSRTFFDAMERALSLGLAAPIAIEAPFSNMHKDDVIRLGDQLGVRFDATLSCMQPVDGGHCGRCSKCRERVDAFREAGVADPVSYATPRAGG